MKLFKSNQNGDYYSSDTIAKIGADFNIIYGERSNGKSYDIKIKRCLMDFLENGYEFVLLRRYDTDIRREKVESYFSDVPVEKISAGKYNEIYCYSNTIYLANNSGGKRIDSVRVGYVRALNVAQTYSGTQYPNVRTILLEEFISIDGRYLPNELFLFNHILSTIARRRNVTVYLLANSISRISPYWREFGIEQIVRTQQQGTIYVITRQTENGEQKIAVEYCANTAGRSRMFAGQRAEMINNGKWLVTAQPRLPYPVNEYSVAYTFVVEYKINRFLVQYLVRGENYCLYVTPKTSEIKSGTRVISDRYSDDPYYTVGFRPLSRAEAVIFQLMDIGKIFFCDDQTGTEFDTCIKNMRRIFT